MSQDAQALRPDPDRAATARSRESDGWHDSAEQARFVAGWLDALRRAAPGIQEVALFVEEPGADALRPVGVLPEDGDTVLEGLAPRVGDAVARQGIVRGRSDDGRSQLAMALRDGDRVVAVAALTTIGSEADARRALTLATGWVAARLWQRRIETERARFDRGFGALDLMAATAEQRGVKPAALALASELALWLPATRVAVGICRRPGAAPRLTALSGGAWFRRSAPVARALEDAMGEALDQDGTVCHPCPEGRARMVDVAHAALLDQTGGIAAATVPLFADEGTVGAITAEFDVTPRDEDLLRLETVAALAAPLLALKQRDNAWIAGRVPQMTGRGLRALTAAHRPSFRVAAVLVLLAAILPAILQAPLRIETDATLRGAEERAVVATVPGFIARADIRPGQEVEEGDLLLAFDDRDLALEAERLSGETRRLRQEARQALADRDAPGRALTAARLEAAEAELALALAQLERVRVTAPVSGTVVSGDHRRRLGAPVEAGELLHEIAQGDRLEVSLGIDERDLSLVAPGMDGRLALSGAPGLRLPLTVTAVTPVAEEREGRRLFNAEAQLTGPVPEGLVPGMEGFARIEAGDRSLWSLWTRRARDWLSLQAWRWRP